MELVVASFLVLFQELALIRWVPGQVRVAAYFPNLILLAAFLGLGLGALRSRKRSLLWLWPVSLAALVLGAAALSGVAFTDRGVTEHLWLLYSDLPATAPTVEGVEVPIVALFVLSVVPFIPLGQYVARRLQILGESGDPLWAYALDLGGSLLGIVAFALVGFGATFPVVWFGAILVLGGILHLGRWKTWPVLLLGGAVVLVVVTAVEDATVYSPYYALSVRESGDSPDQIILANGSTHQVAVTLGRDKDLTLERSRRVRAGYHLPYDRLRTPPKKVLVLGAGTGNDVAALLDRGVEEIHAVEIDPRILELGREHHPERPYASPRVTTFTTDARSYLTRTREKYDLVVFGTLDSMTRLSALSNVRLDNFVYTLDAMQTARERLREGGGMVLYFMVGESYVQDRLQGLLTATFGEIPARHIGNFYLFNTVYMAGPAFAHLRAPAAETGLSPEQLRVVRADVPTDDWPYLYLAHRGVSGFYLMLMAIFAGLAVVGVLVASPELRSDLRRGGRGVDLEMFLFGVGFLLLETRFVTSMTLVWGATWITSAVVFGAIVGTILLGTVLMALRPMSWRPAVAGLVASLLLVYLVPVDALLHPVPIVKLALSVLVVGIPVFFASICFALRFRTRDALDRAFGWNLLGAVGGGLLEFVSMAVGLKSMLLAAMVVYLVLALLVERESGVRRVLGKEEELAPGPA